MTPGREFSAEEWAEHALVMIAKAERGDPTDKIIDEVTRALYGPRFCQHCQKVQPVQTFKVEGSDTTETNGTVLTVGFTGSRACTVCFHTVE